MADCHRRVSKAACKSRSGFNNAGWRHRSASASSFGRIQRRREVHGGLSCEIVSDLCPNPFSHDWHVQPSCQRPNRLPPERRAFSSRRILSVWHRVFDAASRAKLDRTHLDSIRLSSKPFKHIVRAKPCQRQRPTTFPRDFHMVNLIETRDRGAQPAQSLCHSGRPYREESAFGELNSAQRYCLPPRTTKTPMNRRMPKRKTEN